MTSLILQAPAGKYRLIEVDTFDRTDFMVGDFDTKDKAISCAKKKTKDTDMLKMHIYDDTGKNIFQCGTY